MGLFLEKIAVFYKPWFKNTPQNAKVAKAEIAGGDLIVGFHIAGTDGNDYSIVIQDGDGENIPLSAVLEDKVLTITLATDGSEEPDATENTAAKVGALINGFDIFEAAVVKEATVITSVVEPIELEGGQFATPAKAPGTAVVVDDAFYFAPFPVDKSSECGWYLATFEEVE